MKTLAYIDGTNFLTELGKAADLRFKPESCPDVVLNLAAWLIHRCHEYDSWGAPYRFYWFGSYSGGEDVEHRIKNTLRQQRIEATLFKRKERKEKGVDICLTKEMLVNAFHRNCERSVLYAGDEDYLSLVTETKRYGQLVHGKFFKASSSPHLILSLDEFYDFSQALNRPGVPDQINACRDALGSERVSG